MEVGSILLLHRFVSKMLMRVVPGARGSQTYLAVVGFWRDLMMSRRPGGLVEDLIGNDVRFVKVGGCPQVECVNGNFG
jgi:hypothetical protein